MTGMSERESLAAFLFDRNDDVEVLDVKFLRGNSPDLTAERMCATVRQVLDGFLREGDFSDQPPSGRIPQRDIADIIASY